MRLVFLPFWREIWILEALGALITKWNSFLRVRDIENIAEIGQNYLELFSKSEILKNSASSFRMKISNVLLTKN